MQTKIIFELEEIR